MDITLTHPFVVNQTWNSSISLTNPEKNSCNIGSSKLKLTGLVNTVTCLSTKYFKFSEYFKISPKIKACQLLTSQQIFLY